MATWDPQLYRRFATERDRPFDDLLARVHPEAPGVVVDLGCGQGSPTLGLLDRWPSAQITGVDSAPEMIAAARAGAAALDRRGEPVDRVRFETVSIQDWAETTAAGSVDVVVSNAALQWLPDHLPLVPVLAEKLRPGGWLAIQVPGNHDAPTHVLLRELAAEPRYDAVTAAVRTRPALPDLEDYFTALAPLTDHLDLWESTYQHVLTGSDPVLGWISGTGARPILQALQAEHADLREDFEQEYRDRLRRAYPARDLDGVPTTLFPFRRLFVVARRNSVVPPE